MGFTTGRPGFFRRSSWLLFGWCAGLWGSAAYFALLRADFIPAFVIALSMAAVVLALDECARFFTPRITVDEQGLRIRSRTGSPLVVYWDAVRVARHSRTWFDEKWVLECPERDVALQAEWTNARDWQRLTAWICDEVTARGHAVVGDWKRAGAGTRPAPP